MEACKCHAAWVPCCCRHRILLGPKQLKPLPAESKWNHKKWHWLTMCLTGCRGLWEMCCWNSTRCWTVLLVHCATDCLHVESSELKVHPFFGQRLRDLTSKNNGIKWMCSWEMPTSITVESFNQLSRQQQTPLARWFIMLLNSRFYRSQTSLDPAHFQPLPVTALWTLKCKTSSHGQQWCSAPARWDWVAFLGWHRGLVWTYAGVRWVLLRV